MPSHMTITSATTQPSIAWGPPSADMSSGIVMNGPMPIMFVMLSAVACNRPKRRVIVADGGWFMLGAGGGKPTDSQPSGVTQRSARDGEAIGPCRAERPTGVDRERLRAGARCGIGILAVAPLEQLHWCPPRLDVPHDQADDAQKQQDLPRAPALFQLWAHGLGFFHRSIGLATPFGRNGNVTFLPNPAEA